MTRLTVFLVFACFFAFTLDASANTLFFDDFNNAPSTEWQSEVGNWATSSGVYQSPTVGFNLSSVPFVLSDLVVEVDVNNVWDGGIFLRANGDGGTLNGISLITGGEGGRGLGLYWHEWQGSNPGPILNHSGTLFPQQADIHLRIVARGNLFEAYLNNAASPVTTLTSSLFSDGVVALYINRNNVAQPIQNFDNFSISSVPLPPTAVLLAGALAFLKRRTRG